MTRSHRMLAVLTFLVCASVAAPAWADTDHGAIANAGVAAAGVESRTRISVSGGVGYRFNRAIGFGIEIVSVPTLGPRLPDAPTLLNGLPIAFSYSDTRGHLTTFTTNVRLELPINARRVIPYVIGGGGIDAVTQRYTVRIEPPPLGVTLPSGIIASSGTVTSRASLSATDLALTLGGGVSLLATDHLAIDLDARYLRLQGNRDIDLGRFGAGISYRF